MASEVMRHGKQRPNIGELDSCIERDFLCVQTAFNFRYNGQKTLPPPTFPPEMEEACKIIEYVVNTNLLQRKRHPLEYTSADGQHQPWSANVAASNCYTGAAEGVGAHSDGLSYLGPYPTIASLSLGVRGDL